MDVLSPIRSSVWLVRQLVQYTNEIYSNFREEKGFEKICMHSAQGFYKERERERKTNKNE